VACCRVNFNFTLPDLTVAGHLENISEKKKLQYSLQHLDETSWAGFIRFGIERDGVFGVRFGNVVTKSAIPIMCDERVQI